ncbi:hypothetical protein EV128_1292 [Rhizobium azibense]|nr:hypothetical protein EV128_1292 [Rhizobium azibense]
MHADGHFIRARSAQRCAGHRPPRCPDIGLCFQAWYGRAGFGRRGDSPSSWTTWLQICYRITPKEEMRVADWQSIRRPLLHLHHDHARPKATIDCTWLLQAPSCWKGWAGELRTFPSGQLLGRRAPIGWFNRCDNALYRRCQGDRAAPVLASVLALEQTVGDALIHTEKRTRHLVGHAFLGK